jgi:SAM-dependent methyltransferase
MTRGLRRRVARLLYSRGMYGSLRHPLGLVLNVLRHPLGDREGSRLEDEQGERFDRVHGVQTAGTVLPHALQADSANLDFSAPYQPVAPEPFFQVLRQLPLDFRQSLFIDFGSGRGRAVLLASELPFKRVVGVEFSPELHRLAEANRRSYRSATQACRDIELVCLDAVAYPVPPEPAVYFFFNPFGEEVMRPVARNLAESLRRPPRPAFVVYFNPQVGHVWQETGAFDLYPIRPPSPPFARPPRSPAFRGLAVAVWVSKGHAGGPAAPGR